MKKVIVGFVGPLACGKGTICRFLEEKHGAFNLRFSTILRDILDRVYLPHTRDNLQNLSTILRDAYGQDVMAKAMAEDATSSGHEIIVIDGVRRVGDIKYLAELPNFYLISIDADIKTRFARITQRRENPDDAEKTFEQFVKENESEAEQQIKDVQTKAHYWLNNDGSEDELFRQIDEIIAEIRK